MDNLFVIFSTIGVINSLVLITFFLRTKKGVRIQNQLFALLVFALTLRIGKSVLLFIFSDDLFSFLLNLGLAGFLSVGPLFFLFTKSVLSKNFKLTYKHIFHFLPALIFIVFWWLIAYNERHYLIRDLIYRTILIQYIIYMISTQKLICEIPENLSHIKKQLNYLNLALLIIWLPYMLNSVNSHFFYLIGALVYTGIVYFSLVLLINKGYIINFYPTKKYEKTGLTLEQSSHLASQVKHLMEKEEVFKDNTISLSKLAKRLKTSTHALSQVINENEQKTFYELLSYYRITAAKLLLKADSNKINISEIAFEVGYNSLSAFNKAFKQTTGQTPSQFEKSSKDEK